MVDTLMSCVPSKLIFIFECLFECMNLRVVVYSVDMIASRRSRRPVYTILSSIDKS